jgi:serine/threonine protein kinase
MTNVFISHATGDRAAVEEIVEILDNAGFETWYSKDDIQAASDWENSIRDALQKCDWFVVALSRASVASRWVAAEVGWAFSNRPDRIVPVVLEPCDPARLHLLLPTRQHVDFGRDRAVARRQLLAIWNLATAGADDDRFTHIKPLGRGGMGEVSLAFDNSLKRHVAIKRIAPEYRASDNVRKRFIQEGRNAAGLNHPNIVPILSIDNDDKGPFLVLEYMEGGTLAERLEQGALSLPESLAYARDLLSALRHAHEQGMIHRDVKPRNILLTKAGVPKLADFGLAWLTAPDTSDQDTGARVTTEGTRLYMAPELIDRSEMPNPRTDLYSFGVTFYQMMTARPPLPIDASRVPSVAVPFLQKLVHDRPSLRFATAADALAECVDIERALDLAERTEQKTRERLNGVVAMAFEHCAENRLLDAETAFARVLAKQPDHFAALTGMLLVQLSKGDMSEAEHTYRSLRSLNGHDPAYSRLRAFLEAHNRMPTLTIVPAWLSYSYRLADLRRSRLVKELVESSDETINLGDIGELLIELAEKQSPDDPFTYSSTTDTDHEFEFRMTAVTVNARYRITKEVRRFFGRSTPGASVAELTIDGEPFERYRLIRYLVSSLKRRFHRSIDEFVAPGASSLSPADVDARLKVWKAYEFDFAALARFRHTTGEWRTPS